MFKSFSVVSRWTRNHLWFLQMLSKADSHSTTAEDSRIQHLFMNMHRSLKQTESSPRHLRDFFCLYSAWWNNFRLMSYFVNTSSSKCFYDEDMFLRVTLMQARLRTVNGNLTRQGHRLVTEYVCLCLCFCHRNHNNACNNHHYNSLYSCGPTVSSSFSAQVQTAMDSEVLVSSRQHTQEPGC